ncbi:MAG: carboxypeptidase-like regulatory domain-containing protein [Cyclobacteriaceae bacterium]
MIVLVGAFVNTNAQSLLNSRHSSYYTYIYQLTTQEARQINHSKKWEVDSSFFHTLITSFPTDSLLEEHLPEGHYLSVVAKDSRLQLEYFSIQPFDVEVFNNSRDLNVKVYEADGQNVDHAAVKVGLKTLRYDKKTSLYQDRKSNKNGLIEVEVDGFTAFYQLKRGRKNSIVKRIIFKTLNGTPLKYPVFVIRKTLLTVVRFPKDVVNSIRFGYPQGLIQRIVRGSEKLYFGTLCLFDKEYCNWYGDDWKFRKKYGGYLTFSKPKYMPGDTIKMKAFIVKKKRGKPLKKSVFAKLYMSGNSVAFDELKPYAPGGYAFEFVIGDTITPKLDRNYSLTLYNTRNKRYLSGSFRYEDYELGKIKLDVTSEKGIYYRGDSAQIKVTGKDENDLNLLDARVEVTVRTEEVIEVFGEKVFVPNVIFEEEIPLLPTETTQVVLSEGLFPNANLRYEVEVRLLTSDNESKTQAINLEFYHQRALLQYELRKDSVDLSLEVNGVSKDTVAQVIGYDVFGNEIEKQQLHLPSAVQINPYYQSYKIELNKDLKMGFDVAEEEAQLTFNAQRTTDSLFIKTYNPRKIPFVYYLFKTNQILEKGNTQRLDLSRQVHGKENYYLSIQYLWGGRVFTRNYEIALDDSELNVSLSGPPVVYPGQTVSLNLKVTDFKGRPVEDADILAHGLTSKFKANPVQLPNLKKERKQRELINTFSLNQEPVFQDDLALDYDLWNPLMRLDSIQYFNFLYPDSLFRFEYVPSDSITQFAPFVVKEGVIQPVNVIYLDDQVIYLGWSMNEPYSFKVDPGFHQVRIRTDQYEYYVDDVFFEKGKKLIFSIDHDRLPKGVRKYDRGIVFTKNEISNLERYSMYYRNTFGDQLAYIAQGDRIFKIAPLETVGVLGPMSEKSFRLNVFNGFETKMTYEPRFEYEFEGGLVKMRSADKRRFMPLKTSNRVRKEFLDQVNTVESMEKAWSDEIRRRRLASRRYINPWSTIESEGKLVATIDQLDNDPLILNALLFKLDDPYFMQVYPGLRTHFQGLKSGLYRLIFLLDEERYFMKDSIEVKVNGANYLSLDSIQAVKKDSFSIQANQLMDQYFQKNADKILDEKEKERLYKTYQKNFQYFGEGEVVSGVVTDDTGEPLPGVTVLVKGTSYGTVTDLDGYYSIKVPLGYPNLVFSFIGFSPKEIDSKLQSGSVSLETDVQQLSEVVVVGYGAIERKALTSSISEVSSSLQGMVAGVAITDAIKIRGNATISGESPPLIVVDGVPYFGKLEDLNPAMIKNVEVLKSEAMTALYGARAANGVLLISTGNGIDNQVLKGLAGEEVSTELLEEMNSSSSIRTDFSDEAFWYPSIRTDKRGEATVKVTFPDDITSWDTFVYAMTGKQSGQTRKAIKSFKPLTAQINAPRFVVENDSALAIGKSLNYAYDTVEVKTTFELNGQFIKEQDVRFSNVHLDTLLLQTHETDSIQLKYYLTKPDGYFDGEQRMIPVYPQGVSKSVGEFATMRGDTSITWNFPDSLGKVHLYANARNLDLLREKIEYLIDYPYDCNEQLASRLKALVVSLRLDDDLEVKSARDAQIKRVIRKLERNQNEEGFWGWWNQSPMDNWISVHVLEALKMAQKAGFEVKIDRTKITDETVWMLTSHKPVGKQVDALYMSALVAANIDYDHFLGQLDTASHSLASRLMLSKSKQLLNMLPDNEWLLDSLQKDQMGRYYLAQSNKMLRCFYSDRSVEWTAHALNILGSDSTVSPSVKTGLENYLLDKMNETRYYNTFTLSNTITALSSVLSENQTKETELTLTGIEDTTVVEFPYVMETNPGKLMLQKTGLMPLYITAYQTYWQQDPSQDTTSFTVTSNFEEGGLSLDAGQELSLEVEVKVHQASEFVMIEIPIPAGCSYASKNQYPREVHREYFREKVSIFCRKLDPGLHHFEVKLLPRYAGKYTLNPAKAALMYFPVFYGHEGVKRVSVE